MRLRRSSRCPTRSAPSTWTLSTAICAASSWPNWPASVPRRSNAATCAFGPEQSSTPLGSVNFLFDRSQRLHLTGDQLSMLTGIPKRTLAAKAKLIRDLLRIGPMEPELCRRELLDSHPLAWLISVNGVIVDVRDMPPEIQAIARRKGLIPELPVPNPKRVEKHEPPKKGRTSK